MENIESNTENLQTISIVAKQLFDALILDTLDFDTDKWDNSKEIKKKNQEADKIVAVAQNLWRNKKTDDALIIVINALNQDPNNKKLLEYLSTLLLNNKCYEDAEKLIRKYITLYSDEVSYTNLGIVLHNQEKFEEAEKMYRIAIAMDDQYIPAYNCIGALLFHQNKLVEAKNLFFSLIRIVTQ